MTSALELKHTTDSVSQLQADGQPNVQIISAITELKAQISALTKNVEKLLNPERTVVKNQNRLHHANQKTANKNKSKGECSQCLEQGNDRCTHCFY